MAYTAGNLRGQINAPPGRNDYRYDSTDLGDVVETAGYFNNVDDDLNLAIGDLITFVGWSATPFAAGSVVNEVRKYAVTNVIARDAAASAGNVDIAEVFIASGILSSLN